METSTLFSNAKFGDRYRTRDGRLAIFLEKDSYGFESYHLAYSRHIDYADGTSKDISIDQHYTPDGRANQWAEKPQDEDIVGYWDNLPVMSDKPVEKPEHYKFTEKQIEHIKWSLAESKPQKYFFEDMKFDVPADDTGGIVFTDIGRRDFVGENYGIYSHGQWYFYPVHKGTFTAPKVLGNRVLGYIPFKND